MKALVLGAGGLLGHELLAATPPDVEAVPSFRSNLDITDAPAVDAALASIRPNVVLNAAAYSAVDQAEAQPDTAFAVNEAAVTQLGRMCATRDIRVVHFSTDYVFDGTSQRSYRESDPASPVNVYGRSKLAGERGLLQSGARALIVRSQWLYGEHGTSFPRTMWGRARRREHTRVVSDQRGRPTNARDLAVATWKLVRAGASGILHVANTGDATWYDVAVRVFAAAGVADLVDPCDSSEYPRPARRPKHSVLDTAVAERVLGAPLPHWAASLDGFLARLRASDVQLSSSGR